MNLLTLTTFLLLSTIAKSQNVTQECRGIYDDENLDVNALDVCLTNTLLNPSFPINSRYVCENNVVYNQYWYNNDGCVGNPESDPRVETDGAVCEGLANCPYAIIRVYEYNNNCDDYGIWSDRAILVNICQLSTNTSDNVGSSKLECDRDQGVIRNTYSGENCDGDMEQTIAFPSDNENTNTCVVNDDGVLAKFISCNERKNATTPVAAPTSEPTPRPSAGGTYPPTLPTAAPTPEKTDDAWFITSLVFICLFGVLLCGMVWLAFFVMDNGSAKTQYNRAPTNEEAGVETTNYN